MAEQRPPRKARRQRKGHREHPQAELLSPEKCEIEASVAQTLASPFSDIRGPQNQTSVAKTTSEHYKMSLAEQNTHLRAEPQPVSSHSQPKRKQQKRKKKKGKVTVETSSIQSSSHHQIINRTELRPHTDEPESLCESGMPVNFAQAQESDHEEVKSKLESVECQTFRTHFGQLLNAITNPDMLAVNLYANSVISVDTLKEIDRAESTHSKSLALLLAVQEQISFSPATKFRDFVNILKSDPSLQQVAFKLDPKSDSCSSDQSEMNTSSTSVASDHQSGTTRLTERHHSALCEYLNKHAAQWRTIGQYLGFLPGELGIIKHDLTLAMGGPVAYLSEMLAKWLQWAPGDGRESEDFATLEALKYALNKAGFGVTATELRKSRLSILANFSSISEYQQHVVVNRNDDTSIMHQSHETTRWVIGKTMKEANIEPIQLSAYDEYAIYLRGYYTRKRQSDDKWPHLGVRKYIRLAIIINELESRMDLDRFRKSTIHGSIDDVLEAKAPIELSKIFNLHMVDYKRQVGGIPLCHGKNGGVTVCHKYEVCHTTQVLIEGAPGIGKSTLSCEICERWARGELFTYFSMALLLKFRDKWVQDAKCLSDLFGVHYQDHETQQEITRGIESTGGKGLLLILEGYDEAPALLRSSESIFVDLFTGKLLPKATVVITTRPSASSELRLMCRGNNSRRIEVLGFGAKEISEYIHSSFTEHVEQLPDFELYLELYPHIHSMMYVPLNSAIVTHVYQECKSTSSIVPKTMTELYSSLVRTLLLRYLREHSNYKRVVIRDFTDLKQIPGIYEQFLRLCEIAYSGIMKAQTELIFSDLPSDFNTLGLMQSCPELYIDQGESYSHNFLHLTIQEFLAAYHISLFDEDKFESEIKKQTGKPVVIKFLVGLCQSNAHFWKTASKLIPVSPNGVVSMPTLHMLFEAHDLSACTALERDKICFHTDSSMKPFDCYVLGSCIASNTSTYTWEIDFFKYNGPGIDYQLFFKGLIARTHHVKPAIIMKHITNCEFHNFSSALEPTFTLEYLEIIHFVRQIKWNPHAHAYVGFVPNNYRRVQGWNERQTSMVNFHWIKELLTTCTLKCLALTYARIQYLSEAAGFQAHKTNPTVELSHDLIVENVGAIQCLAETLETNSTLEHLDLSNHAIRNEGVIYLARALQKNSTLKYLNLSHNKAHNQEAISLAEALETNSTLEHLDLSDNVIRYKGAIRWAKALQKNSTLKYLNLSHNKTYNQGAIFLAKALETNSTLEHLDLSDNVIRNKGAIHLAKALEMNSTLKYLNLSQNIVHNQGAICLAKVLESKSNSTLEHLDLGNNEIQNEGAIRLARALEMNSTLKYLNLSHNNIESEGKINFAWHGSDKLNSGTLVL